MSSQQSEPPEETPAEDATETTDSQGEVAAPEEPLELSIELLTGLAILGGVVVIAIALAAVFQPSLVPELDASFVIVIGVGAVTSLLGGRAAYRGLTDEREAVDPPLVEYRATTEVPGEDVDAALLNRGEDGPMGNYHEQRSVSDRLERLVEKAITHRDGDADPEAQMEEGTWTDRPLAASFFKLGSPFSRADRLRLRLQSDSPFQRQAREVIDTLATDLGVTDRGWSNPDTKGDVAAVREGWVGRVADMTARDRELGRWQVVGGLTLLAVGLGVVVREPALVLAATVGAGLLAYGYAGSTPTPRLAAHRELSTTDPHPGEEVTVTLTVENTGSEFLFDLRLLDGVPPGLDVESGTPRHGTALQPGASVTLSYTVTADRGVHDFDEVGVLARNASGSVERTATVGVEGATRLQCAPRPTSELEVPVRSKTSRDVGRVVTDTGGSGIEFHSVREYRHGDPLKRVDWSRVARGDGLATLQFNVERSTTVVLLVDARVEAFVAPDREAPSAVDRSLGAASEVFVGLLDSDDRVGLASISPDRQWLEPGAGHGHWAMAREMLTDTEAFTRPDPDQRFYLPLRIRQLRKQLPQNAQLVLFSPLADDAAVEMARRLHAYDYPMTVVSPDTTGTESPGRTVARIERRLRLSRLRRKDVRVVDWAADEPLEAATDRARRRWSR